MGTNGLFMWLTHLIVRLIGHTHAEKSVLAVLNPPLLDTVASLCQSIKPSRSLIINPSTFKNLKVHWNLEILPTLFLFTVSENWFFSCLVKLAGWAQNWRPSWRRQNILYTALVVLLSCRPENLEWLEEKTPVF